jgi:copper(I)-binding protein
MRLPDPTLALLLAAFLAAPLAAGPVAAADYDSGPIHVAAPWARATARPGMTGGGFMAITNRGKAADRLIAMACADAQTTEVHRTVSQNGVMKMLPVDGLDLPPGRTVTLSPGGLHAMMIGLSKALAPGQTTTCTLTFQHAAPLTVQLAVQSAGAMSPGMAAMPGM